MSTVIITGASRGLGKAIAEKFAENRYDLYLSARSDIGLYKAVEELQARFPFTKIKAQAFDVSIPEQAKGLGQWLLGQHISVDVLVNNAGSFLSGYLHDEAEGTLENMMQTNLYSAYHLSRALLPGMMHQPLVKGSRGHIFNMCSVASLNAYLNGGSYSISKFALAGFSKNLREELKEHAIKVTAVYPGAVYTGAWVGSGVDRNQIMIAADIAAMIFAATQLSAQATVEDIIIRPQLGNF